MPERKVHVHFEVQDGGTLLTLTQGEYGAGEAEDADKQSHLDGWRHFLPVLAEVLQPCD